jgi:hypothetical protein
MFLFDELEILSYTRFFAPVMESSNMLKDVFRFTVKFFLESCYEGFLLFLLSRMISGT